VEGIGLSGIGKHGTRGHTETKVSPPFSPVEQALPDPQMLDLGPISSGFLSQERDTLTCCKRCKWIVDLLYCTVTVIVPVSAVAREVPVTVRV